VLPEEKDEAQTITPSDTPNAMCGASGPP
jgi:hypothetical protein